MILPLISVGSTPDQPKRHLFMTYSGYRSSERHPTRNWPWLSPWQKGLLWLISPLIAWHNNRILG